MKKAAIALFLFASLPCLAQTDNTFYARQFPGTTVGQKVALAQQICSSNLSIKCFIVIDPSLAAWPAGTMPSLCAQCILVDFRTTVPYAANAQVNLGVIQTGSGLTGLAAFPGNMSAPMVNGVYAVDGTAYPATGAGVKAAITAALTAGGGIVDARGVCNATFSSELDIGNASGTPITLLLPSAPACAWTSSVNDGTSDGFKAFNNSHIVSEGQGSGGSFTFVGGGSFNGAVVFDANGITSPGCSSACGGYGYYRGFSVVLNGAGGGTASIAVFRAIHYGDNSIFESLEAAYLNPASYTVKVPHVAVVYDACCNTTFRDLQVEGQNGSTAADYGTQPLLIGDSTNTWYTLDVVFDRVNPNHPGKTYPAMYVIGTKTNRVHISSVYSEGGFNATDTTTPVIDIIGGASIIDIGSVSAMYLAGNNTKYILSIASGSSAIQAKNIYSDSSAYCVNDVNYSITVSPPFENSYCYGVDYSSIPPSGSKQALSNSAYGEIAKSSSGGGYAATPSFGPNFYGGWWSTSNGANQTQFGHLYCQATQSNAGAAIPTGRCTIQSAASGGTMTDVASFFGNGDVSFGSSPDTDCGPLCVNGVSQYVAPTSFTPALHFGTSGTQPTVTASGQYTVNGNQVQAAVVIYVSNMGTATGNATITGLDIANNANFKGACVPSYFGGMGAGGGIAYLIAEIEPSSTAISLFNMTSGNEAALTDSNFVNGSNIQLSCFYMR